MSNHRFRLAAIGAFLAGTSGFPVSASAQLGRLKKAAADAVKDKAGVKTESPAAAASSNFVITADRLNVVVAALETRMAMIEREAAARAVQTDYANRRKAFETCAEDQLKLVTARSPSMEGVQRSAAMTQQSALLGQRLSAAQKADKPREYLAMADTLQVLSLRSTLAMYNMDAKCAPVYMPAAMIDANAARLTQSTASNNAESNMTAIAPADRAGMTTQQFGMVRERMALWVLQQTNNAPVGDSKYSVFTSEEQAVLDAQGARIKKWAPIFKNQPSTWTAWGDIKSW